MSNAEPVLHQSSNTAGAIPWYDITSSYPETLKERFECVCGMEMLVAEDLEEDNEVQLAFWQYGSRAPGWRYRLRTIWRVLRTGSPYGDYFILTRDKQRALGVWLLGKSHKQELPSDG